MTLPTLRSFTVLGIVLFAPPAIAEQQVVPIGQGITVADPALFDKYTGYYQLGPHIAIRLFREGNQFYLNTVGTQQKQEIFLQTPERFAVGKLPITISFAPDANGAVTAATFNQAGRDIAAPRITEAAAEALVATAKMPESTPRTWTVMTGMTIHAITHASSGGFDYWPCFSPDGKIVLFSRSEDAGKTWSLYRVAAVGGVAELFAKLPVNATRASWSPAGRIVFNGDSGNVGGLWMIDGDGHNAQALATPGIATPSYPSWYPGGTRLAFGDAVSNILYHMAPDAGPPMPITHQDQVLAGMSSVSPDGNWIAFAGQKNDGQVYNQGDNRIWVTNDAGEARQLDPGPGRTPSWSPDGKRIAFESGRGSPNGFYAVFIINRDGSGLTQVTDYALNAGHPVFSPDGKHLVFAVGTPNGNSGIDVADLPER